MAIVITDAVWLDMDSIRPLVQVLYLRNSLQQAGAAGFQANTRIFELERRIQQVISPPFRGSFDLFLRDSKRARVELRTLPFRHS